MVYENCPFVDIGLVLAAFELANVAAPTAHGQDPYYSVSFLSSKGGVVQCSSYFSMHTEPLNESSLREYDVLFIAGRRGTMVAAEDSTTIDWPQRAARGIEVACGARKRPTLLRSGIWPSASGINNLVCPTDRKVDLTADNVTAKDPNAVSPLITALSLIKSDFDYETAESIAEHLLPFSGQWLKPLLGTPSSADIASTIRKAIRWIEEHCTRQITVGDMAQSVSLSERTFLRYFKAKMGMTPSKYLLRTRLDFACRLLLTTTLPIDKIARRCGFNSGVRLAKVFRRQLGISATDYRRHTRDRCCDTAP